MESHKLIIFIMPGDMELTAQKRAHQSGQTSSIGQELSTLHPMLNIEVVTENEDETGLG